MRAVFEGDFQHIAYFDWVGSRITSFIFRTEMQSGDLLG